VEEPRGISQYVPLTLLREKGTYGTVTVNFEVSITRKFLTLLMKKRLYWFYCIFSVYISLWIHRFLEVQTLPMKISVQTGGTLLFLLVVLLYC